MFRVIILLKDVILRRFAVMSKGFLRFIIQNLDEKVPIHPTINLACIPGPIPKHAAPHHHRSTSKLYCTLYQAITQPFPCPFPSPSDPRQLILVSSDHTTILPSFSCPESNLCARLQILFSLSYASVTEWGFFWFTTSFIPVLLRFLHTVCEVTG